MTIQTEYTLTEAEIQELDEKGFVLLENMLTSDETDALRERAMAVADAERAADNGFVYIDGHAQRVWNLVNKGEIFEQAIQRPEILGFMRHLLGDTVTLSSFTVNIISPGADATDYHLDRPLSDVPVPRASWPFSANSMWFLDDFTATNGATWVVPGSHKRLVDVPDAGVEYDDAVQALGPRGSVMIMNGSIWHRSGANTSAGDRVALLGFFCRAFLKPQQDHLRLVGEEVVARATPTLRQLLGHGPLSATAPKGTT
tara:strand:- start:424 stop:1194 length:771 start_codon:yes stop_codon:yes gene_type:complete